MSEAQTLEKELSFEKALEQVQKSVQKLESGSLELEESLKQFELGVRFIKICESHLKAAEQKVILLTKNNDSSGMPS